MLQEDNGKIQLFSTSHLEAAKRGENSSSRLLCVLLYSAMNLFDGFFSPSHLSRDNSNLLEDPKSVVCFGLRRKMRGGKHACQYCFPCLILCCVCTSSCPSIVCQLRLFC